MNKKLLIILLWQFIFCLSWAKECSLGHTANGTNFGEEGSKQYAIMKHGPDGAVFLDPYFLPFIENLENKVILDAGCGAAPWAIYAAMHGAMVYGMDIQERMINHGKEAVEKAGLEKQVILEVADVANLPYKNAFFDKAISINVGCNLPSTRMDENSNHLVGFGAHFKELARVLKENGKVIITAPDSFEIVFTSGKRELSDVVNDLQETLNEINVNDPESIKEDLTLFEDVYRATFFIQDGKLKLVTDINELVDGEKIWRKIPGMVVPNVYHSEKEYIQEALGAGFKIINVSRPQFNDKLEWIEYNAKHLEEPMLGDQYIKHSPFLIIELELI